MPSLGNATGGTRLDPEPALEDALVFSGYFDAAASLLLTAFDLSGYAALRFTLQAGSSDGRQYYFPPVDVPLPAALTGQRRIWFSDGSSFVQALITNGRLTSGYGGSFNIAGVWRIEAIRPQRPLTQLVAAE